MFLSLAPWVNLQIASPTWHLIQSKKKRTRNHVLFTRVFMLCPTPLRFACGHRAWPPHGSLRRGYESSLLFGHCSVVWWNWLDLVIVMSGLLETRIAGSRRRMDTRWTAVWNHICLDLRTRCNRSAFLWLVLHMKRWTCCTVERW